MPELLVCTLVIAGGVAIIAPMTAGVVRSDINASGASALIPDCGSPRIELRVKQLRQQAAVDAGGLALRRPGRLGH